MMYVSYHIDDILSTPMCIQFKKTSCKNVLQLSFLFIMLHFLSPVNTGNPRARVLTQPKTNAKGFAKKILKSWRKIIWVW